jgi:hypothetical protein
MKSWFTLNKAFPAELLLDSNLIHLSYLMWSKFTVPHILVVKSHRMYSLSDTCHILMIQTKNHYHKEKTKTCAVMTVRHSKCCRVAVRSMALAATSQQSSTSQFFTVLNRASILQACIVGFQCTSLSRRHCWRAKGKKSEFKSGATTPSRRYGMNGQCPCLKVIVWSNALMSTTQTVKDSTSAFELNSIHLRRL